MIEVHPNVCKMMRAGNFARSVRHLRVSGTPSLSDAYRRGHSR
jgi:hypothetical protein